MFGKLLTLLAVFGARSVPLSGRGAPAEAQVTIQVDANNPGITIPADFSGLGFEVAILREENGRRYFRPDNAPLIHLFHTLGIKSLRVGGNTSDRDVRQLPSDADLDSLFGFAKAAGVKVIYCLRLHNGDPAIERANGEIPHGSLRTAGGVLLDWPGAKRVSDGIDGESAQCGADGRDEQEIYLRFVSQRLEKIRGRDHRDGAGREILRAVGAQ